jgi:hypothetical protein
MSVASPAEQPLEDGKLFPYVNDSIRRLANGAVATDLWEFICECPEVSCHVLVSLTLAEFDERRAASPPVAILAAEHNA